MAALADIRLRDPFILVDDAAGRYVLYGTSDPEPWSGAGTGFDCWVSVDLETWLGPYPAFRPPTGFWGTTQFWAPEVVIRGDEYVMTATFSDGVRRGTQVLRAGAATGPFLPDGDGPLTPEDWQSLDGTLWEGRAAGEEGPWLVFCHEWTQVLDGTIVAQPLTDDLRAVTGPPVQLFAASDAPWTLLGERGERVTDGPWFLPPRADDPELVMIWSSFDGTEYAVGVARSASGRLRGPWRHDAEPILIGGGHAMTFTGFDGRSRIVFHAPNDSPNERVVIRMLAECAPSL